MNSYEEIICQVCKGTGREKHKYIRDDGELVEELLVCETCKGVGRIKYNMREITTDAFTNGKFDFSFGEIDNEHIGEDF